MSEDTPVNTGVSWPDEYSASVLVRRMQVKLHHWAGADRTRRFHDLFNLVCDPAFLTTAWRRVSTNTGARTPGVDRATVSYIVNRVGVSEYLTHVRQLLKSGQFQPVPVRQVTIPKASGKLRKLGIPTVTDRVVQAALKLVLEPIFETDFQPCSYGFRPNRRAADAIAEIHYWTSRSRNYEWIVEADIAACFDEIDHTTLMDRVRVRIKDRKVLSLVKAFLKAGVMTTAGEREDTWRGTPQGGIFTPPTQWATRLMVTLRVVAAGFVVGVGGAWVGWDAVADGDVVGSDEDVLDDEAQDALSFADVCGVGAVVQLGEEGFDVGGEVEVSRVRILGTGVSWP